MPGGGAGPEGPGTEDGGGGASTRADVLVLGGGLVGCASAFHLARRGAGRVVLLDPGAPGRGATGRSAGILSFQGWDRWDLGIVRESAEEYRTISERLGLGSFQENGGLRVVRSEEGVRWLGHVRAALAEEGVAAQALDPAEVQARLPASDLADVREGLLTPGDATFDALELAAGYAELARHHGAELHWGVGRTVLREERRGRPGPRGGGWTVETPNGAGGGPWRAPHVVLACGAWTKEVLREVGRPLPLSPFRTQACVVRPFPLTGTFPTLHDTDLGIYVRPASGGRALAGNGTDPNEADVGNARLEADASFVERLQGHMRELFPSWGRSSVETAWAGLCTASPDAYPLVGRVPGGEGLYVAGGLNGFGAMRAGGLARRLAEGILEGRFGPLDPADPGRFAGAPVDFAPVPTFPLRDEGGRGAREGLASSSGEHPHLAALDVGGTAVQLRPLARTEEVDRLALPPLSDWFDPFLMQFMRDALRCGGEVRVAESDQGRVLGAYLWSPAENAGSIFTRARPVAERFLGIREGGEVYAERSWRPGWEPIHVMLADLRDWEPRDHPLRTPVRVGTVEDMPGVERLVREVAGPVDEAWFRTLPRPDELAFVCEEGHRIIGVSWLSVVGQHGRGHSLAVHPRYRNFGLGTDMLVARMLWLKERGVRDVVSEIHDGNEASRRAAERAGMAKVGTMWVCPRR